METQGDQSSKPATVTEFDKIKMEYEQVNENIRMLADIRFKLLALVPPLGGVAIFVLSKMAEPERVQASLAPPLNGVGIFVLSGMAAPEPVTPVQLALVCLVATLGFLATLGITFYDQRNSELYNALGGRANYLEHVADLQKNRDLDAPSADGQFLGKPGAGRLLFGIQALLMKHDRGLALIYGPMLGAWFFPIIYSALGGLSALGLLRSTDSFRPWVAIGVAAIMVIVFILELLWLDDTFSESRVGIIEDYPGNTILLKYEIRGERKELKGKLRNKTRVQTEGKPENCNREQVKLKCPKGTRVRVTYRNSLFTKPNNLKRIFKIEWIKPAVCSYCGAPIT